jgi:hypothetical protein
MRCMGDKARTGAHGYASTPQVRTAYALRICVYLFLFELLFLSELLFSNVDECAAD